MDSQDFFRSMSSCKGTLSLLDAIQKRLEKEISYAAITEVEDLFHEEDNRVERAFTFSRGTRETIAVIGEDGYLYYYGHPQKRVAKELLPDIFRTLFLYLEETFWEDEHDE